MSDWTQSTKLVDGLPDYERMMSRSLALWDNALEEMERADPEDSGVGPPASCRLSEIREAISRLRALLPPDPGIQREKQGLWHELEQELDFLHKRIVHSLPDREYAHRKLRLIEELNAQIKIKVTQGRCGFGHPIEL